MTLRTLQRKAELWHLSAAGQKADLIRRLSPHVDTLPREPGGSDGSDSGGSPPRHGERAFSTPSPVPNTSPPPAPPRLNACPCSSSHSQVPSNSDSKSPGNRPSASPQAPEPRPVGRQASPPRYSDDDEPVARPQLPRSASPPPRNAHCNAGGDRGQRQQRPGAPPRDQRQDNRAAGEQRHASRPAGANPPRRRRPRPPSPPARREPAVEHESPSARRYARRHRHSSSPELPPPEPERRRRSPGRRPARHVRFRSWSRSRSPQ
eukprot:3120501-Rhodomonas_salina.1